METQQNQATTDPEEPQTWGQGRWDDSIRLRQADYAVGIQRHLKKERLLRRLARKTMDGTIGKETSVPEDREGDDMIVLGNYSVTITEGQPQKAMTEHFPIPESPVPPQAPQQAVPQPQPTIPPAAKTTTWQRIWPWLLAAAVPAAGAGGAVAANWATKPPSYQDTWLEWDFRATDTQQPSQETPQ